MDGKVKHLEMIQVVINRMASNSFLFKGWSITIIAGLSAFAAKDAKPWLLLISLTATVMFWFVDAYYLSLERLFRDLYDKVAISKKPTDFSMKIEKLDFCKWFKTLWRPVLCIFYGIVIVMLTVATIILWRTK